MALYPEGLDFFSTLKGDSLRAVLRDAVWSLRRTTLPSIRSWSIPWDEHEREDSLTELESAAPSTLWPEDATDAKLNLEGGHTISIYLQPGEERVWVFKIILNTGEENGSEIPSYLIAFASITRDLFSRERVVTGNVSREEPGVTCLPHLPIAGLNSHLVVTTEAEVTAAFEDPEVFFDAGWTTVEPIGEKYLMLRGMTAAENPVYLAEIISHQWDMARAAKPGQTKYYAPQPEPEELEIYEAGEPTLSGITYIAAEKRLEMTCYLEPEQHVKGSEIFDLWALVEAGELTDGRKLDAVRVIFFNREMAAREKRPLLDVGAEVFYYDPNMELTQLKE